MLGDVLESSDTVDVDRLDRRLATDTHEPERAQDCRVRLAELHALRTQMPKAADVNVLERFLRDERRRRDRSSEDERQPARKQAALAARARECAGEWLRWREAPRQRSPQDPRAVPLHAPSKGTMD